VGTGYITPAKVAPLSFRPLSLRSIASAYGNQLGFTTPSFIMNLNPDVLQPTADVERVPAPIDVEKNNLAINTLDDSDANSRDFEGEKPMEFQRGVERVRIITSIWGRPTLISMFVL
jgi:hypothetical protein